METTIGWANGGKKLMNYQPNLQAFTNDIQDVESTLLEATADLTNPLGELVRAQIKRSQPPIYGAVVLTVSSPTSDPTANLTERDQAESSLHRKRILLAAALEMLHVALNVHRLLVKAALNNHKNGSDDPLNRAFIGSTILAGDYCFSRAAQMAAQTDHPRVVATFSLALQTVSEELLREQFNPEHGVYDERPQLLEAGAQAAARLIDLPKQEELEVIALSQVFVADSSQPFSSRIEPLPSSWQILSQWFLRQHANGERPALHQSQ
jgi:hypothetical protein